MKRLFSYFMIFLFLAVFSGCPVKAVEDISGKWKHQSVINEKLELSISDDGNFEIIRTLNGVVDDPLKGTVEIGDSQVTFKTESEVNKALKAYLIGDFLCLELNELPMYFERVAESGGEK